MINIFLKITQSNQKHLRYFLILFNDLLIINFSLYLSYIIRIEYLINILEIKNIFIFSNVSYLILFIIFRIDKQYFRYFSSNSLKIYLFFFALLTFFFGIFVISIYKYMFVPRSLILLFPAICFFLIILNRKLISNLYKFLSKYNEDKTIVFGLNISKGQKIINQTRVIFFVDDNIANQKRIFNGVKVINTSYFKLNYKKIKFENILIYNEKVFSKVKNTIREHIAINKILVQKILFSNDSPKFLPYYDFNYILYRRSKIIQIDNHYKNKVILITGAGGSIGTGIINQLLNIKFKKLILIDNSEYNLYKLSNILNISKHHKKFILNLLDFSDQTKISQLLQKHKVDVIFHTAAYKHVPLIEINPFSSIQNNFFNTFNFIKTSIEYEIPYFCLISSDKAVRPTNIMGASKRLAELSAIYLSKYKNNKTIINSVRFGNVINSSGSVLPLFENQISKGGPLTVTHKNIIRYFMTIEEAANLVISVNKISNGGEIFLLDMGNQIKLKDLAELMIQFSGKRIKTKHQDGIEIKFIGLRDGEKLYEELLVDDNSQPTNLKNIYKSVESIISRNEFEKLYRNLKVAYKENNEKNLLKLLENKYINFKNL